MNSLHRIAFVFLFLSSSGTSFAQWQQMDGPHTCGNATIAAHNNVVFLVTPGPANFAVYRSTDNAATWSPIAAHFFGNYILNLFVVQDHVVLATNTSLYRSSDDGVSWDSTSYPPVNIIRQIVPAGDLIICGNENGSYLSSDVGTSWRRNDQPFLTPSCYGTASQNGFLYWPEGFQLGVYNTANNLQKDTVYTGYNMYGILSDGGILYGSTMEGMIRSTDEGQTWRKIPGIQAAVGWLFSDDIYIYGTHMFRNRIYRYNKSSASVDSLSVPFLEAPEYHTRRTGNYRFREGVSAESGLYIVALGKGVIRSTDHGETWTLQNGTFNNAGIEQFESFDGKLYAAAGVGGLVVSSDGGATWNDVDYGGRPFDAYGVSANATSLYAHNAAMDIYQSVGNDHSWQRISTPEVPYDTLFQRGHYSFVAMDNDLFAYAKSFVHSSDNGTTWSALHLQTIFTVKKHSSTVYVPILNGMAYSSDNGTTWDSTKMCGPTEYCAITVFGNDNNTILAVTNRDSVYVSTDAGQTWVNAPRPSSEPWYRHGYPTDVLGVNGSFIVAYSSDPALYITHDNGLHWDSFNDGLYSPVEALYHHGDYIYAGTMAAGIWRRPVSELVGVEEPKPAATSISLRQNYPNPFNPTTTISYSLPSSGYITLTITNTLGKEAARLVDNARIEAGTHRAQFDAKGLPSGMYFYTLRSGNMVLTKSMVLEK